MRALTVVLVGMAAVAAAEQPPLVDYVAGGGRSVVAGPEGEVAVWDRGAAEIMVWDEDGKPVADCRLENAQLPAEPGTFGYGNGRAFLAYFDFEAGSETDRKCVIVDTDRCEVEASFSLPGIVHQVAATEDGWLAVTSEPFASGSSFVRLGVDGDVEDAFTLDREFAEVREDRGIDPGPITDLARPMAVGRELWVLPHLSYELWRPPQRGRSFHRVSPPSCLAATGRTINGDENVSRLLARAKGFPEPHRSRLEQAVLSGRSSPSVVAATAGFAVRDRVVAVKVADPRMSDGARLDLWDMFSERVVAVVPFPLNARIIALADRAGWILEDGERLRRIPLPDLYSAEGDVCRAVDTVAVGMAMEQDGGGAPR